MLPLNTINTRCRARRRRPRPTTGPPAAARPPPRAPARRMAALPAARRPRRRLRKRARPRRTTCATWPPRASARRCGAPTSRCSRSAPALVHTLEIISCCVLLLSAGRRLGSPCLFLFSVCLCDSAKSQAHCSQIGQVVVYHVCSDDHHQQLRPGGCEQGMAEAEVHTLQTGWCRYAGQDAAKRTNVWLLTQARYSSP